jgi:hypothetical protein
VVFGDLDGLDLTEGCEESVEVVYGDGLGQVSDVDCALVGVVVVV